MACYPVRKKNGKKEIVFYLFIATYASCLYSYNTTALHPTGKKKNDPRGNDVPTYGTYKTRSKRHIHRALGPSSPPSACTTLSSAPSTYERLLASITSTRHKHTHSFPQKKVPVVAKSGHCL